MLPVIVFPWYTPPSRPAPLCCAPGKQPLPAMRRCWVVGRQVRPETRSRGTESSQGSPSLCLPLPCGARHQVARAGDVLLKRQDLSSGGKSTGNWLCTTVSPFLSDCGAQRIVQLQSPVCVVRLPRRGQRSEAAAVQEAIGFDCKHLFSIEGYL